MRAMISQPMRGLSDEEILSKKKKAEKVLNEKGYEILNSFFSDDWNNVIKDTPKEFEIVQIPVSFLAMSLSIMSFCHAVYFCKGWENARGCKIEHDVAIAYGLEVIYEE